MNNLFNKIAIISLGGLTGGVIGYFVGGLVAYKFEMMEAEKMLNEIVEEDEEVEKEKVNTPKAKDKIAYNKFVSTENPELEDLVAPYKSTIEKEGPAHKEPYMVTEEFATNPHGFENVTLIYYDKDDTLCDMGEGVIDDVTKLLGPDGLTQFGPPSTNDPDCVYICNPKENKIFEIQRIHKSYAEDILGLKENKKPPVKKVKAKNGHKVSKLESDDEE